MRQEPRSRIHKDRVKGKRRGMREILSETPRVSSQAARSCSRSWPTCEDARTSSEVHLPRTQLTGSEETKEKERKRDVTGRGEKEKKTLFSSRLGSQVLARDCRAHCRPHIRIQSTNIPSMLEISSANGVFFVSNRRKRI